MSRVFVTIEQRDIDAGKRRSCQNCAFALAATRAIGLSCSVSDAVAEANEYELHIYGGYGLMRLITGEK